MLAVFWLCVLIGAFFGWAVPTFTLAWGALGGVVIGVLVCMTAKSPGHSRTSYATDFGLGDD
jgi:hypothetical protein